MKPVVSRYQGCMESASPAPRARAVPGFRPVAMPAVERNDIDAHDTARVVMLAECWRPTIKAALPEIDFVQPHNLCAHMKRITMPKILDALVHMRGEVVTGPATAERARRSVEQMVNLKS